MDDSPDRYTRLVAAWNDGRADRATSATVATEAARLAGEAPDGWHRVMAAGLAAAARASSGGEADVSAIIDATPPPADPGAVERLEALLPGPGPLAARLAAHDASTVVPRESLAEVANRLVGLLHGRAAEDLGLPADVAPPIVDVRDTVARFRLSGQRVVFGADRRWTLRELLWTVGEVAVPGGYLANQLRAVGASWRPSPHTTVEHGLWTVGREVLLGDHEFAHELGRIGRRVGLRWFGDLVVAVGRARDDLAPAYAALALAPVRDADDLRALGCTDDQVAASLARWEDPLARADDAARAAGPPLVRDWMVRVGQTVGLARLLAERLTPSDLRADGADG